MILIIIRVRKRVDGVPSSGEDRCAKFPTKVGTPDAGEVEASDIFVGVPSLEEDSFRAVPD